MNEEIQELQEIVEDLQSQINKMKIDISFIKNWIVNRS